ncbi:unnamed protein product [Caenorhabditis auriculariae]|uniref:G-protein coupled receptors family 1 profile domain-containing protein n=1 Tax=Caenorhabditis auriculariae TaxID=2777116 RepID=A0A8S1HFM0_9PELO|nr:unnamed protein product [Caenorhabditis auriculariae]
MTAQVDLVAIKKSVTTPFDSSETMEGPSVNMTQQEMEEFLNETTQLQQFYNETIDFERKIGIIIPSIFAVIILVGVVGNLLVVIVALSRQMRNSTNTLIIGLAVSDLMFLLLCIPFTAVDYATPTWIFPEWTCSMINFFQHTSAYCSVWTLALMALDRYLAVVYPVDSMTLRTPKNTFLALVVIYAVIMASQIPVGMMHGLYSYDFFFERRQTCAIISFATFEASKFKAHFYFMTFNLFGYVLPLGISVFLYWRMLRRLWDTPRPGNEQQSTIAHCGSIRSRPEARRAKKKVTRLVLCVLITWALCWLPLNVCFFMSGLSYPEPLVVSYGVSMVVVQISSQVLAYMNSCLNPILYALMSENFRKGFIRILKLFVNKLTLGQMCKPSDKFIRLELTNCNNTINSSLRQAPGEKSSLLKDRTASTRPTRHVRKIKGNEFKRSNTTRSFNL